MLCAKVIEASAATLDDDCSPDAHRRAERIQSLALRNLLDLRQADAKRHEEFSSFNIAAMLHKVPFLATMTRHNDRSLKVPLIVNLSPKIVILKPSLIV